MFSGVLYQSHVMSCACYVFRGIVPITCDELFKTMATNGDANVVSGACFFNQ